MFPAASRKPPSTPMNSSTHERAPMCVQGDSGLVLTTDPKPRLRWTAELHDRFVDAVNQLGGPDKATPKTIMRVMGVKGLTLYHLKSHLQVQKHLQIRIEAQGKYMQSILEKAYQTLAAGQGTEAAGEQLGFVHDMADLQLFGGTGDLQLDNSHQLHLGSIHHLQPPDHGLYLTASPALIGKKMIMAGEKSPFIWDDEAEDDDSQLHNIGIDVAPGVIDDGGYEAKPTIPNADDDKLVLEGTAKMDRPSPLRVLNHPLSGKWRARAMKAARVVGEGGSWGHEGVGDEVRKKSYLAAVISMALVEKLAQKKNWERAKNSEDPIRRLIFLGPWSHT
ncbi:hypothetical protein ZIOFF_009395 [Zingiber officinale]|uniref:HTH myb-type domain-containing protein n=1 Tax=Zingiber officinale TaxID=94328 RepID=A0A8J5LWG8_ZINOF|nr:hypothetical protein ZIOFF_009395 [Zingiber officinale]